MSNVSTEESPPARSQAGAEPAEHARKTTRGPGYYLSFKRIGAVYLLVVAIVVFTVIQGDTFFARGRGRRAELPGSRTGARRAAQRQAGSGVHPADAEHATAVLLDHGYLAGAPRPTGPTPLMVVADRFEQEPGGPVTATEPDNRITPDRLAEQGACAIKLLVIWCPDESAQRRADLVGRFVALARRSGTIALVEAIVRPPAGQDWAAAEQRHDVVLTAAVETCRRGPDLYKAEVPGYRPGDLSQVARRSRELDAAIGAPWVVLSDGVRPDEFAGALREACSGGARGFLAGRAVWWDALGAAEPSSAMRERCVPRLAEFASAVRAGRSAAQAARVTVEQGSAS